MHIGVLDSGIGGLALLAVLVKRFPGNRFTYYSDNRYAPYGSRNIDYLKWRVHTVCEELVFRGAEAIALGCNTAGSNLASELRSTYSLPIAAVCPEAFPEKEKTLVMCTPLTALSRGVREYAERGADVYADPALVPLIEKHRFDLQPVADYVLPKIERYSPEAVSLGCTHYVYLAGHVSSALGVKLYDGCGRAAEELAPFAACGEAGAGSEVTYVFSGDDERREYEFLLRGLLERG